MQNNDGKLDAREVAELLKEWQKEISSANAKVETAIKSIEEIRSEMRNATKQISDAKAIYDSSWKSYFANNWWKGAIVLIIVLAGLYFLIEGKKLETSKTPDGGFNNKIEDLRTKNN